MPQVTLPGSTSLTKLQQEPPTPEPLPSLEAKSPVKQEQEEQASKHAGGVPSWWGRMLNRFSRRRATQMKLPDDKNPSVSVNNLNYF
jgi:hypothetical protein